MNSVHLWERVCRVMLGARDRAGTVLGAEREREGRHRLFWRSSPADGGDGTPGEYSGGAGAAVESRLMGFDPCYTA